MKKKNNDKNTVYKSHTFVLRIIVYSCVALATLIGFNIGIRYNMPVIDIVWACLVPIVIWIIMVESIIYLSRGNVYEQK